MCYQKIEIEINKLMSFVMEKEKKRKKNLGI